ncbi:MAG: putative methyltransferase [Streptosporangiales bacterium]|nr:putative methyltransferase [Streptosporangiales bacterium]
MIAWAAGLSKILEASSLPEPVKALLLQHGIGGRRIGEIYCLLAGGKPMTIDEIVSRTGASRRLVETAVRAAGPHVGDSHEEISFTSESVELYRDFFRCCRSFPEGDHRELAEMESLVEAAPGPLAALDHVPAIPETVLKRAYFMLHTYELRGARILCLGDHDLTSLGIFLAGGEDGLTVDVVDVDERTLEYIDREANRRDFGVQCYFGDLRIGLPSALKGAYDLIFTDPPYTPEGMRLFVSRGLEALRDDRNGRLLVAYGFGEQHPALGLSVQNALAPLHLVYEAVLPGFNRYTAAQAIGSTAAMYVLRPTRRSAAAARRLGDQSSTRVYTHGAQSVESASANLGETATRRVIELADSRDDEIVLVGGGHPSSTRSHSRSLKEFLGAPLPEPLRMHAAIINLYPEHGESLLRVLLAANAPRVVVVCPNDVPEVRDAKGQRALAELVGPKYRVVRMLRSTPTPDSAVVVGDRTVPDELDPSDKVVRHVYERAHGKIGNCWREGLIAFERSRGLELAKGQARERIARYCHRPELLGTVVDRPSPAPSARIGRRHQAISGNRLSFEPKW